MKPLIRTALLAITLFAGQDARAAEIAGIHFDDRISLTSTELQLNGGGLRTRFMLKVYAIGLYSPKKADSLEALLSQPGPRRIQIVTLRELTAEQFADGLVEGLRKNLTETEYARLQPRIDEFKAALLSLRSATPNTAIRLEWLPGNGTRLFVGNEQRGRDIPGEDFQRALLRIWLGEKPVDSDLRNSLLGRN